MTKDRCVDNSCATPTVRKLHTHTVCCCLPGHYSMPLSSLATKPRLTHHTSQCVIRAYTMLGHRYDENVLVKIIAYNSKK